jgi:hypothetical protein
MAFKTTIEIFTPTQNIPLPHEAIVFAVQDEEVLWFTGNFDGDHWRLDDLSTLDQEIAGEKVIYWFYPPKPEQFAA